MCGHFQSHLLFCFTRPVLPSSLTKLTGTTCCKSPTSASVVFQMQGLGELQASRRTSLFTCLLPRTHGNLETSAQLRCVWLQEHLTVVSVKTEYSYGAELRDQEVLGLVASVESSRNQAFHVSLACYRSSYTYCFRVKGYSSFHSKERTFILRERKWAQLSTGKSVLPNLCQANFRSHHFLKRVTTLPGCWH